MSEEIKNPCWNEADEQCVYFDFWNNYCTIHNKALSDEDIEEGCSACEYE